MKTLPAWGGRPTPGGSSCNNACHTGLGGHLKTGHHHRGERDGLRSTAGFPGRNTDTPSLRAERRAGPLPLNVDQRADGTET